MKSATICNMWTRGMWLVLTIVRRDFKVLDKEIKLEGNFETWLRLQKMELQRGQEKNNIVWFMNKTQSLKIFMPYYLT